MSHVFYSIPENGSRIVFVPLSKMELEWAKRQWQPRLITGLCSVCNLPYGTVFRFYANGTTYVSGNRFISDGKMRLEYFSKSGLRKVFYSLESCRTRKLFLEAGHNVPKLYVSEPPKSKKRKLPADIVVRRIRLFADVVVSHRICNKSAP